MYRVELYPVLNLIINFSLVLDPSRKGLPDGSLFNTSTNFVPPGVHSNLSTHLQYTAMDSVRPTVCDSISSNNIIITDKFLKRVSLGPYLILTLNDYHMLTL